MMKPLTLPLMTAFWMAQAVSGYGQSLQPRIDELAAGMDDFAPEVEELPLEQLADDFGDAAVEPAEPAVPQVTTPKAQPVPQTPKATVAVIPEGWDVHSFVGLSFAVPSHWTRMSREGDDDELSFGDVNMKEKRFLGINSAYMRAGEIDSFEEDTKSLPEQVAKEMGVDLVGAEQTFTYPEPIIAADGGRLLRKKFVLRKDDFFVYTEVFYKEETDDRGGSQILGIVSMNKPEAEVMPIIEQLVGTIGLDAAPEPEAQVGVDGLVNYSMPLPKGWSRQFDGSDAINFMTKPTFSGVFGVDVGYRARAAWEADAEFDGAPEISRGEIFGQPATIKQGMLKQAYFQVGYKMVAGLQTLYKLDMCLANGEPIVVHKGAAKSWIETTGFDSLLETISLSLPDDAVACAAETGGAPTSAAASASGWTVYSNSRFGTSARYPTSHFNPAGTAPENGDGGSFASADGQAEVLIWGSHNALEQTPQQMLSDIQSANATASIISQNVSGTGFSIALLNEGMVMLQRGILDAQGVVHSVIVRYPVAEEDNYGDVALAIVDSLAAPESAAPQIAKTVQTPSKPQAAPSTDPQVELVFWQSIQSSSDPAMFQAYLEQWPNGTFAVLARLNIERLKAAVSPIQPTPRPAPKAAPAARPAPRAHYYEPARKTAERSAIMDAARVPMLRELGQKVIFLVKTLRTDGEWCFLMAEPLQPNGKKLNWYSTPYANDWANDAMSDLVMVLMRRQGNGWQVVDYVIGPTDVHWYSWIDRFGLPERLFTAG